ncbi:flavodoxin family protein [Methanobacterium sp. ACI-7]|uniref:flavodoxin family protein n=1 Tax=unclassified Methanobacterium TaxID=2627676 RepID=UPI0039C14C80
MKIIAFNGSPRKKCNTADLLKEALEGTESKGTETELINLYSLKYTGCKSCFACKKRDGKSYGKCKPKDDLKGIFEDIENSDAIILGSPIYYGTITGQMKSFVERLLFQYMTYTEPPKSLFPKNIKTGLIYTMNIPEERVAETGYDVHFKTNHRIFELVFGHSESLFSYDTYQFKDYSKVVADRFDEEYKAKVRREVFPEDRKKAFDMGVRFASE